MTVKEVVDLLEYDGHHGAAEVVQNLIDHISAMANDPYLMGHPEWPEIVKEVKA